MFPPMENPDQLRELWRMQKALNQRIGVQTNGMSEADAALAHGGGGRA